MHTQKIIFFLLLLINLIFYSCTEKFYLDSDSEVSILVVDGKITNQAGPYEVNLYRTVNLYEADTLDPETDAIIFIKDGRGNSDTFIETSPGVYETQDLSFQGQIGESYWIEIETSDGEHYESNPETIQPSVLITSIYGEEGSILQSDASSKDGVEIFMDAQDSTNESNYLRWEYQESWEWQSPFYTALTDNPSKICYPYAYSDDVFIYDGSNLSTKSFSHLSSTSIYEDEVKLNYEYFIRLSLYSINFSGYEFWNNIQSSIQNNGSLYDVIPSNAAGNICACDSDNLVLGYFEASSVSTKYTSFSTDDFEMEFPDSPPECELITLRMQEGSPDSSTYYTVRDYWEDDFHIFLVRYRYCYDCNVKYSPTKPSFWP
ncbi:DUF4249 domain-containing protein [Labilibaculum sp.]|uniref:DUF4249 domain-containing protein n=1 Tax=Labilibaculum sp. TaxID=2060723 RepID=UPI00356336CA